VRYGGAAFSCQPKKEPQTQEEPRINADGNVESAFIRGHLRFVDIVAFVHIYDTGVQ
jgi:hypothetical protein